ncbi:32357_t:CDS:2 [Gigaspora margarita]|uniref:32357_t:CDS:1 n=1 Tax=Gigaspora margarita TaxID=4874 RepID=A0ABN7UJ50_GIGMA|nr:32357_t:CDS:2 [Gigaspora margarita]
MSELFSENKAQEMSTSMVNKDSDDSRLENEPFELEDNNNTLNKRGSKDIERLDLLDETNSLKTSEKINGQSGVQDGSFELVESEHQEKQQLQNDFKRNLFERMETTSIVEEQASTDINAEYSEKTVHMSDNDTELLPKENELGTIEGSFPNNEEAVVFEADELNAGDATIYDNNDGVVPNNLENESNLSVGKQSSKKENDLSNSGKTRCILVYEGQEFPLHVKLNICLGEWMQDLKKEYIRDETHDHEVVLTFKDSAIDDFRLVLTQDNKYSQRFTLGKIITTHNRYRKSHDLNTTDLLIVMTLQERFISQYRKYNGVAGEDPESFDDGDINDYDNILPQSTTGIANLSGTGNSFFKPSKDAFTVLKIMMFPQYPGGDNGEIQYIDSETWKNGAQGFYGVPQIYHQIQPNELYVSPQGPYGSGLGLYDNNIQFEQNDLYGDAFNVNELLTNFDNQAENFGGSSIYYNQTLENYGIPKESIYDETLNTKENIYDETLGTSNSQNNSEALNIDDKAPFVTDDLSAMNTEPKIDNPVAPTEDEYSVNEMEVSKGKRERSCTSDSEGITER